MPFGNPWAPDLTPYENIFSGPLHHEGSPCCHTGCIHCSRCGLGPQSYLTYRYEDTAVNAVSQLSNGLCPRCAAL